jgi:hypothetical protein
MGHGRLNVAVASVLLVRPGRDTHQLRPKPGDRGTRGSSDEPLRLCVTEVNATRGNARIHKGQARQVLPPGLGEPGWLRLVIWLAAIGLWAVTSLRVLSQSPWSGRRRVRAAGGYPGDGACTTGRSE